MVSRERAVQAVVIGGSAGSVSALGEILPGLPERFPAVLVVVHLPPSQPSLLAELYAPRCAMRVREAEPFDPIERGTVYIAPADYHLLVERDARCALSVGPAVNFSRPSIDVLFESAADAFGPGLVGVVLTGASGDGARGLSAIHARGGRALVEDPETAEVNAMPRAALAAVPTARVLSVPRILAELCLLGQGS
ncbi:MAG TPA: chemotaxis protein CheB [Polyangiaceae bacterium]|nr:chemotaxis protein CheB [Polyangiaceae bacterium]